MNIRIIALGALVALAVLPRTTAAHHQLDLTYERDTNIALTGTITAVEWVNPHAVIRVSGADASGKVQTWRVELDPPNALLRRGWKLDQLTAGVTIAVVAFPSKDRSPNVVAKTITLPSGEQLVATTDGSWNWRALPPR